MKDKWTYYENMEKYKKIIINKINNDCMRQNSLEKDNQKKVLI